MIIFVHACTFTARTFLIWFAIVRTDTHTGSIFYCLYYFNFWFHLFPPIYNLDILYRSPLQEIDYSWCRIMIGQFPTIRLILFQSEIYISYTLPLLIQYSIFTYAKQVFAFYANISNRTKDNHLL